MTISHTSKLFILFFICTTFICLSHGYGGTQSQYSIMGPNLDRLPSPNEAVELFQQWMRDHERVYKSLDELERKFAIFLRNLKHIVESNAKAPSSSFHLGLNEFADWSPEDFKRVYLNEFELPKDVERVHIDLKNVSNAPQFLDWREMGAVTPVKNQGGCGCCWAFATIGAIEGINKIVTGNLPNLSEQELLDCAYNLGCIKGGWVTYGYDWVKSNGIATQTNYPYTGVKGNCRASQVARSTSAITSYTAYLPAQEQALFSAVLKQPITANVDASGFQFYNGGIYDGPTCPKDSTRITHSILIVGFGSQDGQDYWIVKNSWGPKWGMDGYLLIKRNTGLRYGVCAINAWATYPNRNYYLSDQSVSSM